MKPLEIFPITGIGEIQTGVNVSERILISLSKNKIKIEDKDVLVITQKIISKAEGQIVDLSTIQPSVYAKQIAESVRKDARMIEMVLRETRRIVRMNHGVMICETHHGFICANAGVDNSNVEGEDFVTLLPKDPDASAHKIRSDIYKKEKKDVAVIISDTWGRPWRSGQVNFAIGIAGINPLMDYRGEKDVYGYKMSVTAIAVVDELASAAELVMGKTKFVPVVVIRGVDYQKGSHKISELIREKVNDLFQ